MGSINLNSVMNQAQYQSMATSHDADLISEQVAIGNAANANEINSNEAVGAANKVIIGTQNVAKLLEISRNQSSAAQFGLNTDDSNNIISSIASSVRDSQAQADAAMQNIKEKQSTSFFDDPLKYIINRYTVNDDITNYNTANATSENKLKLLGELQSRQQAQTVVNAGISEVTNATSAAAELDKVSAITANANDKLKFANAQFNMNAVEAVTGMNEKALSINMQALQLKESILNREASERDANANRALKREELDMRIKEMKETEEGNAQLLATVNLGAGTLGVPRLTMQELKVNKTFGGKATSDVIEMYNVGRATAQATITSGQDLSSSAAIAAVKPVPRLGNTPFAVGDSMATLRMVAPAAESRIASIISNSYNSVLSNPQYNKNAVAASQAMSTDLSEKLYGAKVDGNNKVNYGTSVKPIGGYAGNADGHDDANPFNAPPLNSLATIPAVASTYIYKNILAPQVQAGNGEVVKTLPSSIVSQAYGAAAAGKLTYQQANQEIVTIFNAAAAMNNAHGNLEKYGIAPQTNYYSNISGNGVLFVAKDNVDLTNINAVTAASIKYQVSNKPTIRYGVR